MPFMPLSLDFQQRCCGRCSYVRGVFSVAFASLIIFSSQDTSTSESSLSSAATRIQAGYRGHLARRHRLLGRHGTAGTASTSISMSMSRDSDVGVVRAMSLVEDSEVQRHQDDPLDLLPEADDQEYGPAKYIADVHRVQSEAQVEGGGHVGSKGEPRRTTKQQ